MDITQDCVSDLRLFLIDFFTSDGKPQTNIFYFKKLTKNICTICDNYQKIETDVQDCLTSCIIIKGDVISGTIDWEALSIRIKKMVEQINDQLIKTNIEKYFTQCKTINTSDYSFPELQVLWSGIEKIIEQNIIYQSIKNDIVECFKKYENLTVTSEILWTEIEIIIGKLDSPELSTFIKIINVL